MLCSMSTCDFIITMHCLSDTTCVLSKYLQSETIDVCSAKEKIENAMKTIQSKRERSNEFFSVIFSSAENTMAEMDVEIRKPRVVGKQMNRANQHTVTSSDSDPHEDIVKYWETSVYIPILDNLITDMKQRFSNDSVDCYKLNILVPITLDTISNPTSRFDPICEKYSSVLSLKKDTMLMKIVNEICSLKNMSNYDDFKKIDTAMKCFEVFMGEAAH